MKLISTTFISGISTLIKISSLFVINKVVAMYVGPSGLALIGQLQNFVAICTTVSNGAISSGVVKYTAEYTDIESKKQVFSTAFIISFFCSVFISLGLIFFSELFSLLILKTTQYQAVFKLFGFTLILYSMNTLLISILNGQKEIIKLTLANIIGSFVSLFLTVILVKKLNLIGGLYALVINQSIVFFVTLMFVLNCKWFTIQCFFCGLDKRLLIRLSKYSLMAVVSLITGPFVLIYLRDYIGQSIGWDNAGYWQAIWYISSTYLMVITTSLSVYYLPRLSEIKSNNEIKKEIIGTAKIILPVVLFISLLVYLLRDTIILIAFQESFMPMRELFKWQLIGDFFKIASWLISFVMLAKTMTKLYVFTEIIFSFTFIVLSVFMINTYGLIGITYAFSLNYFLYFMFMVVFYIKKL